MLSEVLISNSWKFLQHIFPSFHSLSCGLPFITDTMFCLCKLLTPIKQYNGVEAIFKLHLKFFTSAISWEIS